MDVHTGLVSVLWTVLVNRPETVVVEETMDHTALGCDDSFVAVHTNHMLSAKAMFPAGKAAIGPTQVINTNYYRSNFRSQQIKVF